MIKIIAEIGWNHSGDMSLAKDMIKAAKSSGADYAKFQSWSVSRLKPGPWDEDGRREIYEKAELSYEDHKVLIEYCKTLEISFLSSVFCVEDAKLLKSLKQNSVKIPSFESRNTDLIRYCNENFEKVFMSTGTSNLEEIEQNLHLMDKNKFVLLHCVSSYPCDYDMGNLPRMQSLSRFGYKVGYSDHIQGVDSAKIAIEFGAEVIEKHFTTDRGLPGRDNKFAILPEEMLDLTNYIKNRELMMIPLGEGYQESEREARDIYTGRFSG